MARLIIPVVYTINLICIQAGAWGTDGHEMLARAGGLISRADFWSANAENLSDLTNVPDKKWKKLPTSNIEKPTHFFQPDSYYSDPAQFYKIPKTYSQALAKFGQATVDEAGTGVWRVEQFYKMVVQALKDHDYTEAAELAGVMTHYIGDLSQPLHVTKNYDGQETGQDGIHLFFETINVKDQKTLMPQVLQLAKMKLQGGWATQAKANKTVHEIIFDEMVRAYDLKDQVLAVDAQYGRRGKGAAKLQELAIDAMADGAATLSIILDKAFAEAGNPTGGVTLKVGPPDWVSPDYLTAIASKFRTEEDCH